MLKILGIVGSPRPASVSGCYKLTEIVLENTGIDYDLISLSNMDISSCIACLGCTSDNICKVDDDFTELRELLVAADAFVISSPNYYSTVNAKTHALLERFFQFRHQEGDLLWGKLGVAVGVGGASGNPAAEMIEIFFNYNFIETVESVSGQGAASCYSCGYGETCSVGIPIMMHGENVQITDDLIPDVLKQPDVVESAVNAGKLLGERLKDGHDREEVAGRMQKKMMEMMKSSV